MDDRQPDDTTTDGAVLRSMVLLSALSTAAEVWHAARERRADRDPTEQEESEVVQPFLRSARRELQEMVMRLRASLVYTHYRDEDATTHLVRRFDDLMTLTRIARLLHVVHQRLLSLYPAVSEEVVEEARELERACSAAIEAEDEVFLDELGPFLERTLVLTARLQREAGA